MLQEQSNPKHFKAFWPIFIILVISAIAATVVFLFANGNITQDDINSSAFLSHFTAKTPAKMPAKHK